jgi:general secretion pathway protein N
MAGDKMKTLRLALAIVGVCLIQGGAESGTSDRSGALRVAAIEIEKPTSDATGAPDAGAPPEAAPRPQPPRAGNPLWAIPMRKLSATRERPLFSPSRRPPRPVIAAAPAPRVVAPPPPVKPPAPEIPPLLLVGTIISDNERIAIFVNLTSNQTKRVREGQEESGWTVRSVDLRAAIVERNHRSVTLDLPKRDAKPAPGAPMIPTPGFNPNLDQTL